MSLGRLTYDSALSNAMAQPQSIASTTNGMLGYRSFVQEVKSARDSLSSGKAVEEGLIHRLLNGAAYEALANNVDKSFRAKYGMFFSGKSISDIVAEKILPFIASGKTLGDPACGAGDLVISAYAKLFDLHGVNIEFAHQVGSRVFCADLHEELVVAAAERLKLLIASRLPKCETQIEPELPNFQRMNYLERTGFLREVDCVVMNPPFVEMDTPIGCSWTSGKVQQAAVFFAETLRQGKAHQEIVAILPDVLRSGSRYRKWRELISRCADIRSINVYGRFDSKTDVDVFILHVTKKYEVADKGEAWGAELSENLSKCHRLEDEYEVSVGALVPHRHLNKGGWCLYLEVANAPKNGETFVTKKRRFNGRLHQGPFVVLRRTSSPSDGQRAVPTVITNKELIAVENHLIVVRPKNGETSACKAIAQHLRGSLVTDWLNTEIRCRHLTTAAVKKIPSGG